MCASDRTSGRLGVTLSEGFQVRLDDNWRTLVRSRANMLIVGPRRAHDAFLRAAEPELLQPIQFFSSAAGLLEAPCRTLVLLDVAALDAGQQQDVLKRTATPAAERPQILSFTETHLWRGGLPSTMSPDLYYRLNTVCIEIEASPATARV